MFTWFAGYRMRFFAEKGLIGDISDVWKDLTGFTDAFKAASTAEDGKQYFVPISYYPWAVFYRKSVWKKNGYTEPKTLDELTALAQQMQKDKLVPIAFADKDGWPAMGTFDILNMRINGYQYHVDLMAGKKAWDSTRGQEGLRHLDVAAALPPAGLARAGPGRRPRRACSRRRAGCTCSACSSPSSSAKDQEDLDFFTFPEIDPAIGADAMDAPIDGFMMAKKPKNEAAAQEAARATSAARRPAPWWPSPTRARWRRTRTPTPAGTER